MVKRAWYARVAARAGIGSPSMPKSIFKRLDRSCFCFLIVVEAIRSFHVKLPPCRAMLRRRIQPDVGLPFFLLFSPKCSGSKRRVSWRNRTFTTSSAVNSNVRSSHRASAGKTHMRPDAVEVWPAISLSRSGKSNVSAGCKPVRRCWSSTPPISLSARTVCPLDLSAVLNWRGTEPGVGITIAAGPSSSGNISSETSAIGPGIMRTIGMPMPAATACDPTSVTAPRSRAPGADVALSIAPTAAASFFRSRVRQVISSPVTSMGSHSAGLLPHTARNRPSLCFTILRGQPSPPGEGHAISLARRPTGAR